MKFNLKSIKQCMTKLNDDEWYIHVPELKKQLEGFEKELRKKREFEKKHPNICDDRIDLINDILGETQVEIEMLNKEHKFGRNSKEILGE